MRKGADLYSGSSTIVGDTGVAEMIPNQRIRHVSNRNLRRHSERRRPRICPPRGVEHGQDPEIDRGGVHPGQESEGEDGRGVPRRTLSRMRWPPRQDKCLNDGERGKRRKGEIHASQGRQYALWLHMEHSTRFSVTK